MPVYPINLDLSGRHCACIGGGSVAARKVEDLLQAGALVTIISPVLTSALQQLVQAQKIIHIAQQYQPGVIGAFFMVICATNNTAVNRAAAEESRSKGALVNVVDAPELCDFTVPSKMTRGDLLITVSTGGKSPALAKKLRLELEDRYGPEYGTYLEWAGAIREQMKNRLETSKEREYFWQQTLDDEVLSLLRQGRLKDAEEKIKYAIGSTGLKS